MKKTVAFLLGFLSLAATQIHGALLNTFALQNPTASAIAAHMVTYGHAFLPGQAPAGTKVVVVVNGTQIPAQLDVKTKYADNSAWLGIVTFKAPAMSANVTLSAQLQTTTAAQGSDVNISALPGSGWTFSVRMAVSGGSIWNVNVGTLLTQQLASGSASYWLKGAQVTEVRVDTCFDFMGSFHLTLDVRAFADGTVRTDVQFNNDYAMNPLGSNLTYTATITQNGTAVFTQNNLTHYQYQTWHKPCWTNGEPVVNIKRDILAFQKAGAIVPYNLAHSGAVGALTDMTSAISSAGWGAPLATNWVTQYMPMTGGRGDIGPTTWGNAVWLMTQNKTAEKFALGQADASGSVPWSFFNPATNGYLSVFDYPDIWTDGRAVQYNTPLTQQIPGGTGWDADVAHMPDLAYIPYLLMGDRYYLDKLNAQADYGIISEWPTPRTQGIYPDIVANGGSQVRGQAWALRGVDQAAFANPDGSPMKTYFSRVANDNWTWLLSKVSTWKSQQGQAYGWLPGDYGTANVIAPWQQDYFASTMIAAIMMGNQKARTYCNTFAMNFLVGRFQSHPGWDLHTGVAYNMKVTSGSGYYQTWAEISSATNATTWSEGDYASLGQMTLAGLVTVTGSSAATTAYNWLKNSDAPFLTSEIQEQWVADPTLWTMPPAPASTGIENTLMALPAGNLRLSVFPNPFHSAVKIGLPAGTGRGTSLKVYDVKGALVKDLSAEFMNNPVTWNAAAMTAGVYLVKLRAGGQTTVQRLLLVK